MMFPYRNPRHDPESARAIVELISWPFRWCWRKFSTWIDTKEISEDQWLSMFRGGHHAGLIVREDTPGVNPGWDWPQIRELPPHMRELLQGETVPYSFDPSAADQAAMLGLDEPYLPGMEPPLIQFNVEGLPVTPEMQALFAIGDYGVKAVVRSEEGLIQVFLEDGTEIIWVASTAHRDV